MWCRTNHTLYSTDWSLLTLYCRKGSINLSESMPTNYHPVAKTILRDIERKTLTGIHSSLPTETYLSTPGGPTTLFDLPNHSSHQEQREETTVREESTKLSSQRPELAHSSTPPARKGNNPQIPTSSTLLMSHHNYVLVYRKWSVRRHW